MKHRITVLFIGILTVFSCKKSDQYPYETSDFRPELRTHIEKIIDEKELSSNNDTLAGNFLKDSCTKEELLKLVNFENPLVRVRAFRAIVNRNEPDYFKILLNHLNDSTKVTWWYYEDAANKFKVSDLFIRKVVDSRKLTQTEKNILIDSVLLKHPYLEVSNWMIQEINPNEKYYSIIKQKSKVKTDECWDQLGACYALSKFKKQEDLAFLKTIFSKLEFPCEECIFKSIEENPNPVYFPILEKYFNQKIKKEKQSSSDDLKYYCRAIVKYKNKESLALLTKILDKSNYSDTWYFKHNEEYVFRAIHKYKEPIYEDLYNKLKPKMSEYVMGSLDGPDYSESKTW